MSVEVKTNVIKRNGEEVHFNSQKIVNAVHKANEEVDRLHQMNDYQIRAIADNIANKVQESTHAVNVEDIQDMVETGIMAMRGYEVAQKYVRYLEVMSEFVFNKKRGVWTGLFLRMMQVICVKVEK